MTGPAIRTQIDGLNEMYSYETALDCSDKPDLARQEFKDETDVNKVLARYGIDGMQRPVEYQQVDYDADLQQMLASIQEAERAISKLPAEIYSKYPTWEQILDGAFNGTFKADITAYYADKAAEKAALDAAAAAALSSREPKP